MKKNSAIYCIVMVISLLTMLIIPFMPYLHMDILTSYLGKDIVNAVDLVREMYTLHRMPGSTNIFGHEHYSEITLGLMIAGIIMIVLPVLLELLSMCFALGGKTRKAKKRAVRLSAFVVLLFVIYLAVFTMAGHFINAATQAGYGIYFGLAASILFVLSAYGCRLSFEKTARTTRRRSSAEARTREIRSRERERQRARRQNAEGRQMQ